jgi:hypothetical protein
VANATDSLDLRIRLAMFTYLERLVARSPDGTVRSSEINRFEFDGQQMRLIVQTGIWKPAVLEAALTIRTTYTPPNQEPPYSDSIGPVNTAPTSRREIPARVIASWQAWSCNSRELIPGWSSRTTCIPVDMMAAAFCSG